MGIKERFQFELVVARPLAYRAALIIVLVCLGDQIIRTLAAAILPVTPPVISAGPFAIDRVDHIFTEGSLNDVAAKSIGNLLLLGLALPIAGRYGLTGVRMYTCMAFCVAGVLANTIALFTSGFVLDFLAIRLPGGGYFSFAPADLVQCVALLMFLCLGLAWILRGDFEDELPVSEAKS